MSKLKLFLLKLEEKVTDLEKHAASQRQMLLEDVVVVLAIVVWLGGMMLIRA